MLVVVITFHSLKSLLKTRVKFWKYTLHGRIFATFKNDEQEHMLTVYSCIRIVGLTITLHHLIKNIFMETDCTYLQDIY